MEIPAISAVLQGRFIHGVSYCGMPGSAGFAPLRYAIVL